jgi:hypothetical protein
MSDTGNGSTGTVANAAGGGASGDDKDPYCEAFAEAVEEWCDRTPPRGSFENVYFRKLSSKVPDVFNRQEPVLFWRTAAGGPLSMSRVGTIMENAARFGRIPGVGSALVAIAGALGALYPSALQGVNWGGLQQDMRAAFSAKKVAQGTPRVYDSYPDGLSENGRKWVEVKRPGDRSGKPGSWQDKARKEFASKEGNEVHKVSCVDCPEANCGGDGGDNCPEGTAPADVVE